MNLIEVLSEKGRALASSSNHPLVCNNYMEFAAVLGFTGERIVPEAENCEPHFASRMMHEHMVRYIFAGQIVSGKSVLDVGCGVGYGAQKLSQLGAASVTAFDISVEAIEHARTFYTHPAVNFYTGNAEDFSFDQKFDIVTCFEMIEHVKNPDAVLACISKHLKKDGILITSTPRKLGKKRTHFHEKEFTYDEFGHLLRKYFPNLIMYYENNHFTSFITKDSPGRIEIVHCLKDQFHSEMADVFIAVAAMSESVILPEMTNGLVIDDDSYVTMLERDVEILHKAEDDLKESVSFIQAQNADVVAFKDMEISRLTKEYDTIFKRASDAERQLWELQQNFDDIQRLTSERDALRAKVSELDACLKVSEMKYAELEIEYNCLSQTADSLRARVEDANARRMEALEFARRASDAAQGVRRELDTLKRDLLDVLEFPGAPVDPEMSGHRHRDIVESMERLFLGTEATHHIARNPLVTRVGRLAADLESMIARAERAEAFAEDWHSQILKLRRTASWKVTAPLRAIGRIFAK